MIVRLRGQLAELTDDAVIVERDGLAYELLVPACTLGDLAAVRGQTVTLHTLEYYEGSAAGGNLIPRLVGFVTADDRAFFKEFITVKGIGTRKALRALVEPISRVAADIEAGDAKALSRLPGIGKRTAEQVIAELRGKVTAFARRGPTTAVESPLSQPQRDALELLVAWGDGRAEAQRWLQRAAELHPDLKNVEDWVKAAYRIKTSAEG